MTNWYKLDFSSNTVLVIYIDKLYNKLLDIIEPIPIELNCYTWIITQNFENFSKKIYLDIDKFINKLVNCKSLLINNINFEITRLPPNLIFYRELQYNILYPKNIAIFPETLEEYEYEECRFITETTTIPYIQQRISILNNIKKLNISCNNLDISILNYISSAFLTELSITARKLNNSNTILWPINIKILRLCVSSSCKFNLGILPHGLQEFIFNCEEYYNEIILPPTVIIFKWIISELYYYKTEKLIYTKIYNTLPDSIEHLTLVCENNTIIDKLPRNCKVFNFHECSDDIIDKLHAKYPQIEFNLD